MRPAYEFDDVRVEPDEFRVLKAGQPMALEPKAVDLLTYLVENSGRLVGKRELLDAVWKDTAVSEGAMTRVIAQLRKALGDAAAEPRYLETVPTRGYRFIGDVRRVPEAERVPMVVVGFGTFELDRSTGELRRAGQRVPLQDQPAQVLSLLVSRPGDVVTRDELRRALWSDDTFVEVDTALNVAVNKIRQALGDSATSPRFVETVPKRGYRFLAEVHAVEPRAAAETPEPRAPETTSRMGPVRGRTIWLAGALAAAALLALLISFTPVLRRNADTPDHPRIRSLAVLPLANLTGDPAQEYFSDGMTDALITNLASLPALRVISRQSVMRYKGSAKPLSEIARELGVEGVVVGSVVRSGGRVRITAQLVHAPTDRHLWAQSYERRMEDVLALQGEVSRAIAKEVRLTLGTEESRRFATELTVNPDAYDAYLLGRHHWNQRTEASLEKALEYFQTAAAKDPGFAPAHAGLALTYGPRLVYGYVPPGTGLAEQKSAALRALALDPGLGDARAALGAVRVLEWDWEGADKEFRRAVETDPSCTVAHLFYGWYLGALGHVEESLLQARRALELDPLNTVVNRGLAHHLAAAGRHEEALAQWSRALELDPNHAVAHLALAVFHLDRGHTAEGSRHLERAHALGPHDPMTLSFLGIVSAASGNRQEASRVLAQLQAESGRRYVSPVLTAYVQMALDQKDSAFALLEKAYAARDPLLINFQVGGGPGVFRLTEERVVALRADPRFDDLVRRMGFARSFPLRPPPSR
jgi:DNA-binding winged helix-turn-helix (wHTH) protein/TolB-like protein/tetratricopeptide (TPR) repeat protein